VSAESVFLGEISKLKRLVFIRFVFRTMLWVLLILLCACSIALFVESAGLLKFSDSAALLIVSAGIFPAVAFLFALARRPKFLNILIDIDTRLKLRDRITTAYEYQRAGHKSVFLDLLMQDAAARLRRLSDKHIVPEKFSLLHVVLVLMIILNAALFSGDYFISAFNPGPGEREKIEKARTLVRNFTMSRSESDRAKKAKRNDAYSRKWEQLKKTMEDRDLTRDQLFSTLNRFLKEIQGEQSQLADELGARLDAAGIDGMPTQNIGDLKKLSAGKLENLKKLINRALNNRMPDDISRDIENMQNLYSMEKLLSRILEDFDANKSYAEKLAESQQNETYTSEAANNPEKAEPFNKHSASPGEAESRKPGNADTAGQPGTDHFRGNDRRAQEGMEFGEGSSPSAGHGKSTGEHKPGQELDKSPGPGIQDKINTAQAKKYLVQIRSMTAIGESKIEAENVLRNYSREVESVLQKEDIPLNYREYIKQYFLSIGMETEDSSPTGNQGSDN
jgi:hypothetical protein